jgi:hypothetical protein
MTQLYVYFTSGLESQNAFSIWQPLAQFSAAVRRLLLGGLTQTLEDHTQLLKAARTLVIFKPTSLAASAGVDSHFLKGLYPHIHGWDSGNPIIS